LALAPDINLRRLRLVEHNMVVWRSEVLQMPQLPDAIRIAVIFSAPSASFVETIVGWAPPFKGVRLGSGVRYVLLLFAHLLPERATAEGLAGSTNLVGTVAVVSGGLS